MRRIIQARLRTRLHSGREEIKTTGRSHSCYRTVTLTEPNVVFVTSFLCLLSCFYEFSFTELAPVLNLGVDRSLRPTVQNARSSSYSQALVVRTVNGTDQIGALVYNARVMDRE
jgi:hypothetical protein